MAESEDNENNSGTSHYTEIEEIHDQNNGVSADQMKSEEGIYIPPKLFTKEKGSDICAINQNGDGEITQAISKEISTGSTYFIPGATISTEIERDSSTTPPMRLSTATGKVLCKDIAFLILFISHLFITTLIIIIYGRFLYHLDGDERRGVYIKVDFWSALLTTGIAFMFSAALASSVLKTLLAYNIYVLNAAMLFNIILSSTLTLVCLEYKYFYGLLLGSIYLLYSFYLCSRRTDIFEFTSANFQVALVAIINNISLIFIASIAVFTLFSWTFIWSVGMVGVINEMATKCEDGICEGGVEDVFKGKSQYYVIYLIISYIWTQQVIKNVLETCVSGTIGNWWYERGCQRIPQKKIYGQSWSVALKALRLSTTTLFGSICAGSLLVTVFQALRNSLKKLAKLRRSDDVRTFFTNECTDCLGSFLQGIHEWAYTFVGIYGFSYFEAGNAISNLFERRGWSTIISDNLIGSALFMANTFVAMVTAIVCMIMTISSNKIFPLMDDNVTSSLTALSIGGVIGFVTSSMILSISSSAIHCVLVCYAESPNQLSNQYPELSLLIKNSLREESWSSPFPSFEHSIDFVKMKEGMCCQKELYEV
eukprot:CAMPEP_0116051766 /NCGR_PEP_ID=MMETSP0322-20121206/1173_1 /TAXON_ID=163516 /ORGANISM="Leptocylindrus danicus var. apora, Strain B651" /LENGTH=594 /DNA_ID=CAMNT_0003534573 /DNA_START=77 /DNA_END=1861 /DNA_ORIENTATION=-